MNRMILSMLLMLIAHTACAMNNDNNHNNAGRNKHWLSLNTEVTSHDVESNYTTPRSSNATPKRQKIEEDDAPQGTLMQRRNIAIKALVAHNLPNSSDINHRPPSITRNPSQQNPWNDNNNNGQ